DSLFNSFITVPFPFAPPFPASLSRLPFAPPFRASLWRLPRIPPLQDSYHCTLRPSVRSSKSPASAIHECRHIACEHLGKGWRCITGFELVGCLVAVSLLLV